MYSGSGNGLRRPPGEGPHLILGDARAVGRGEHTRRVAEQDVLASRVPPPCRHAIDGALHGLARLHAREGHREAMPRGNPVIAAGHVQEVAPIPLDRGAYRLLSRFLARAPVSHTGTHHHDRWAVRARDRAYTIPIGRLPFGQGGARRSVWRPIVWGFVFSIVWGWFMARRGLELVLVYSSRICYSGPGS